jgi:hypothetical protein
MRSQGCSPTREQSPSAQDTVAKALPAKAFTTNRGSLGIPGGPPPSSPASQRPAHPPPGVAGPSCSQSPPDLHRLDMYPSRVLAARETLALGPSPLATETATFFPTALTI